LNAIVPSIQGLLMRKLFLERLKTSAFAGAAMAGLTAVVVQASAPFMPLGEAAPAPVGYLNFCASRPEQCGLRGEIGVDGRPVSVEERSRELNAKYFWRVAFGSGRPFMGPTPTSGGSTAAARAAPSLRGRFNWSTIFGAIRPAAPVQAAVDFHGGAAVNFGGTVKADADEARGAPAPTVSRGAPPLADAQPDRGQTVIVQPLHTDHALLAELDRVNSRINRAIRYVSDRVLYGDEDYWHLPLDAGGRAEGDCKDYVLEKRRALIADGVPAANLSIAIVETSWGETHAVLLVTTDRGELVLDSLSPWIKPWQDVRYRWIERQAPGRQLTWVKLG
jgi:predicted transglutaminase-like cysteine proteinase